MKRSIIALFCLVTLTYLSASGGKDIVSSGSSPANLRVAALVGPSGLGMGYLFANKPDLGKNTTVSFEAAGSADVLLAKLVNGEIDIGILPPNVAAKLYTVNNKSIITGAVVGNAMISLVTRDQTVSTLKDLVGKTVHVAGQGATPEFVLRTLLEKAGINAGSVTLDFSIPAQELAAALVSGKIQYALLPEPFATVALLNGSSGTTPVRRAISLKKEWTTAGFGSDFPMTLCVIRREYAEKFPETVRMFLSSYRDSIEWTVAHPAEAGGLAETNGLGLKAAIAAKSIPECNFVFISAVDAKDDIERLLSVFLAYTPTSIGGKLPDTGFYFK